MKEYLYKETTNKAIATATKKKMQKVGGLKVRMVTNLSGKNKPVYKVYISDK